MEIIKLITNKPSSNEDLSHSCHPGDDRLCRYHFLNKTCEQPEITKLKEIHQDFFQLTQIYPDIEKLVCQMDKSYKNNNKLLRQWGYSKPLCLPGVSSLHTIANDRVKYFQKDRSQHVAETLIKILPEVAGCTNMKILDVGCGYGDYMVVMRELGHEVVGVNPPVLADDFMMANHYFDLNVISHDILQDLPFTDEFDAILCIGVITLPQFKGRISKIINDFIRVAKLVSIRTHENMLEYHRPKGTWYRNVCPSDLAVGHNVIRSDHRDVIILRK